MDEEELVQLQGDKPIPSKVLFKRIFKYIKPEIFNFVIAFIFIIIQVVTNSVMPLFMEHLVETINGSSPDLKIILWCALGQLIISLVSQAFLYIESMILQKVGQRVIYKLRMEVFEHIEKMSLNQFNEMPVGALVTRVANYTTAMSDFFTNTIVALVRNIISVSVAYAIMFTLSPESWKLSLILLSIVVLVFVITFIFRALVGKEFRKERAYISDLNTFINENLSGMKITQLFNRQNQKISEFKEKNTLLYKQSYKVIALFTIFRPLISLLEYISVGLTFYFGISFHLKAGEIVAFYLYSQMFFWPIQQLTDQLSSIQRTKTACERLFNLLDVQPQVLDAPDAIDIDHFNGKIEFKNVWFAYKDEDWILKDVSFVIEPGKTCAFVGATGAGKTTILSLLVRNFEIQKGTILIDDIDIKSIKIDSLRSKIGQMLQDVFLFSGTIKTNINLHDDEYSDEEILKSCEYVNADSFINKLDKGLDSEVSERGENFSQGQRQLLSFARTVLHKPQILILDEATANIDTETEKLIQESLTKMRSIGTMLVVAHRLSTIQNSDKIICLQNGEIVEQGNHQELLKNKGYYWKLYKLQFQDKE